MHIEVHSNQTKLGDTTQRFVVFLKLMIVINKDRLLSPKELACIRS